jgi:tetratricopeptide (TPR) repeat protein
MTKKKQKKSARSLLAKGFGILDLSSRLEQLKALMINDQLESAETLALRLREEFPQNLDVLKALVDIYSSIDDLDRHLYFLQKAIELEPNNTRMHYELGFSYIRDNVSCFYNGVHCLTYCIERWPDYEFAENARSLLKLVKEVEVESILLDNFGLAHVEDLDAVFRRCEQVKICSEANEYLACEEVLLSLIADFPDVPELQIHLSNNLIEQDKLLEAIALLEKTIASSPNAISVYCFLIKNYLLNYQIEQAEQLGERLKSEHLDDLINKFNPRHWVAIFDTLARLRDDATVVKLFEAVETWQNHEENTLQSFQYARILHVTASALYHSGETDQAQTLLTKAFDVDPDMELVQENLADLNRPPEERNGVWVLRLRDWFLPTLSLKFYKYSQIALKSGRKKDEDKFQDLVKSALSDYPYLYWVFPYLLDRGSEADRTFVQSITFLTKDTQLLQGLKEFTLKEKGSQALREQFLDTIQTFEKDQGI